MYPLADAGGGSVIIYRHLKRFRDDGHPVLVVNILSPALYERQQKGEFEVLNVEKKWWFPPLRKKTPWLTGIRYRLLFYLVTRKTTFDPNSDIILGLLGEASNLLALEINRYFGVPYYLFYHDDTIFNRYAKLNLLSNQQLMKISQQASYIFAVSPAMVKLLHSRGITRSDTLYPIPEGYSALTKKQFDVNTDRLRFCAAGMIEAIHFHVLKTIGVTVHKIYGIFYCVADFDDHVISELGETVKFQRRFDSLEHFFLFVGTTIDILVIFYSFDTEHEPRMLTSFPSKLAEYCHLGLPIIIIAPIESTLGQWAVGHSWLSYLDNDQPKNMLTEFKKFEDRGYWLKCRQQSLTTAKHEFDPENIHRQLEKYLQTRQSAGYAKSI